MKTNTKPLILKLFLLNLFFLINVPYFFAQPDGPGRPDRPGNDGNGLYAPTECVLAFYDFEDFTNNGSNLNHDVLDHFEYSDYSFENFPNNTVDIFECNTNNFILQCSTIPQNPPQCHGESFYLPLDKPLLPGCEVTIEFDAYVGPDPPGQYLDVPVYEFYGLNTMPCNSPGLPSCQIQNGQDICGNGDLIYCMDNVALTPVESNELSPCDWNFTSYSFNWVNTSDEEINYIMVNASTLSGIYESSNYIYAFAIDNISVASSCSEACCELQLEEVSINRNISVINDPVLGEGVLIEWSNTVQNPNYQYEWDFCDEDIIILSAPNPWEINLFIPCGNPDNLGGLSCVYLTVTDSYGCSFTRGKIYLIPITNPLSEYLKCLYNLSPNTNNSMINRQALNEEEDKINAPKIYPNPTSKVFSIELNAYFEKESEVILKLFNDEGKLVYNSVLEKANSVYEIDISTFPEGLYVVYLMNDEQYYTDKILITRE